MAKRLISKNDKSAKWLIGIFSFVVFAAVVILGRVQLKVSLNFDVHIFALINAVINSIIAILLIAALIAIKNRNFHLHKKLMLTALVLSIIFLLSYITHKLLAGEAVFGDDNHDGILSAAEEVAVSSIRPVYLFILITHIFLAAGILPFILFTAYRALIGEYTAHKNLAKYTWPLWFYVAITGPVVYLLISPYYR